MPTIPDIKQRRRIEPFQPTRLTSPARARGTTLGQVGRTIERGAAVANEFAQRSKRADLKLSQAEAENKFNRLSIDTLDAALKSSKADGSDLVQNLDTQFDERRDEILEGFEGDARNQASLIAENAKNRAVQRATQRARVLDTQSKAQRLDQVRNDAVSNVFDNPDMFDTEVARFKSTTKELSGSLLTSQHKAKFDADTVLEFSKESVRGHIARADFDKARKQLGKVDNFLSSDERFKLENEIQSREMQHENNQWSQMNRRANVEKLQQKQVQDATFAKFSDEAFGARGNVEKMKVVEEGALQALSRGQINNRQFNVLKTNFLDNAVDDTEQFIEFEQKLAAGEDPGFLSVELDNRYIAGAISPEGYREFNNKLRREVELAKRSPFTRQINQDNRSIIKATLDPLGLGFTSVTMANALRDYSQGLVEGLEPDEARKRAIERWTRPLENMERVPNIASEQDTEAGIQAAAQELEQQRINGVTPTGQAKNHMRQLLMRRSAKASERKR